LDKCKLRGMINGLQADAILSNWRSLLPTVTFEGKKNVEKCWEIVSSLFRDFLDKAKKAPVALLKSLGPAWLQAFEWPRVPLYVHVVVDHWPHLQDSFHPIKNWAQQAVEHHHSVMKKAMKTTTNGRDELAQLMKRELRLRDASLKSIEARMMQKKKFKSLRYSEFKSDPVLRQEKMRVKAALKVSKRRERRRKVRRQPPREKSEDSFK